LRHLLEEPSIAGVIREIGIKREKKLSKAKQSGGGGGGGGGVWAPSTRIITGSQLLILIGQILSFSLLSS